jgi:hypothetical protein
MQAGLLRSCPRSKHQDLAAFMRFPVHTPSALLLVVPRRRATSGGEEDIHVNKKRAYVMNRKKLGYRPYELYPANKKRRPVVFEEGRVHARVWADDLVGGGVEWKVDVIYCLGEMPRPWEPSTHDIPEFALVRAVRALYRAHTFVCKQKKKSGILAWLLGGVK